jgi:hypothetical protein
VWNILWPVAPHSTHPCGHLEGNQNATGCVDDHTTARYHAASLQRVQYQHAVMCMHAGVPGPTTASSTTSVPVEAAGDPMKLQEQLLAAVSASQAQLHDGHQVQQGAATNPPSSAQPSHVPGSSTAAAAAAGSKDSGEGDWVVVQGAASRPPAAAGGTTAPVQVTGTEKGVMEVPISSSAGVPASGAPTAAVEGLMRGVDSYKAPEDLLQVRGGHGCCCCLQRGYISQQVLPHQG